MAVQDIRSLPLYQLIAAPLIAIVQADAQAAQTTLEYIEKVGFLEKKAEKAEEEARNLRMTSFTYKKLDENGSLGEFTAQVPVLSLVPIPSINVKDAKIGLSAKIVDVKTEEAKTSMSPAEEAKKKYYQGWLQPYRTEFRGTIASKTKEQVEGKYNMDITITLEKSDIPLGLSKIFHMMDQAIQDEKKSET